MLTSLSILLAFAFSANAQVPPELNPVNLNPNNNAGKCLTAASNANGAQVTVTTCTGATNQQWSFNKSNNQVSVFGNKCLDVPSGNNTNGVKLQVWTCSTNNANQKWTFNFWTDKLTWLNKNKCLDLTDGSLTDGNRIQIWGCSGGNANQIWHPGYKSTALPAKSQNGQYGTNACGTTSSQTSKCQTAWINDVDDFCLWAPPYVGTIGDTERVGVAYCTKSGRGTRTIPNGALKGIHFVKTPDYVQITGVGDFTKINIPKNDAGGEFDPHGADGNGNPIGGLVYGNSFGNALQYHEWTSFISYNEVCFKACTGPNAAKHCEHIYDVMGCFWNMPGNYGSGKFESCKGNNALYPGIYGTSTFHQGDGRTPAPHPAPSSSSCRTIPTISVSPLLLRRASKRVASPAADPAPTAAPELSWD